MASEEQKALKLQYKHKERMGELKKNDPSMTAQRAMEIIREEERAAEEKGYAAREEKEAAKEREKAAREEENAAQEREKADQAGSDNSKRDNNKKESGKSSGRSFSWPSFGSSSSSAPHHESSGMGIYITLIILSVIVLLIKNYVAYDPMISLLLSLILGVFFFIAVHFTPEPSLKISLVLVAFTLDFLVSQGLLYFIPNSGIKDVLISIHVFIWVILAVVLFLMGVFDQLGAGKHLGAASWILLATVIGLILFLVFPLLLESPLDYQQQSHEEYFQIAQQSVAKISATFAETKNIWSDYFSCTFDQIGQPTTDRSECLKEKRITRYCRATTPREADLSKCITEQQETKIAVVGITDSTITKPTTAEFVVSDYFPRETFHRAGEPLRYPVELKIQNPRKQSKIEVEAACYFRSGLTEVPGKIIGADGTEQSSYQIPASDHFSQPLICESDGDLDGRYEILYNATLRHLETKSRLQRAFIGTKDNAWKEQWIPRIMAAHFPGSSHLSQAPEEFARINFAFGNPLENPIIENTGNIILSSTVENVGRGKIVAVESYELQLSESGIIVDNGKNPRCLAGTLDLTTQRSNDNLYLPTCFITDFPLDLKNPSTYVFKEFEAALKYDYQISTSINVEVNVVS